MHRVVNRLKREIRPKLGFILDRDPLQRHLFVKDVKTRNKLEAISLECSSLEYRDGEWLVENETGIITLRESGSDLDVYRQIFIQGEYEPVIKAAKLNELDVRFIVDAGANIGLTAIRFANAFPNATIYCLEPDPGNYEQLVKNISDYGDRIVPIKKALWNANEPVYIHNNFRDGREWARSVSTTKNGSSVPGITLPSLMSSYDMPSIDILKMDIEGAESVVFSSGSDISFVEKTTIIALEIHDEFDCRNGITNELRSRDFVLIETGELTIGFRQDGFRVISVTGEKPIP